MSSGRQIARCGWISNFRRCNIIEARKLSSAASAANAVVDHIRDWVLGTAPGEIVSMAVASDGSYGIPKGLVFSYPVTCSGGKYQIVKGLKLDKFSKEKIALTTKELQEEKQLALGK
jgi:malate dehydrogenase